MTRPARWIAGLLAAAALLLGGGFLALNLLLPSDGELAAEVGARFQKASGIGLKVGSAHWSLRPSPVVVLNELATEQPAPITVRRVELRPRLAALWRRSIAIESLEIEGAVLPRASVRAFRGRWNAGAAGTAGGADAADLALGAAWALTDLPIERLRLRDVVWIDRRGVALAYDADVRFDAGWRPREAELSRAGVTPPARLRLEREGDQDRWRTAIDVGGGTWNGRTELQPRTDGRWRLTAELEPRGVDVAALVRSFGRRAAVEGKLDGRTTVDAEGSDAGELLRHLHTRTRFSVAPATLAGFDLARAVSSAGVSRGGRTVLDSLEGTLDTQAGEDGVVLRYSGIKARSGVLTASGSATVLNRRLDGEMAVDLVDGVVGVPLKLGGTLDAPELSLTGGALAGAAMGSAVLPGVGTAIGARIGQQMEKLFGSGESRKPEKPAPRSP
ncbi:AsmA-like C-terminal region-containing protein [Variovorax saccharolyticus]|uniref:AsmA-like C-terminal region-containing protein n=1 Tax=Variovorax saccharolyticus TaxID=3053516 RepID=UPI002577794F|nr:AsmA-like C-terminal region-containing protein [Variovorax sp. J31P216]MDM0028107.1 AsmA-like C-terminal region-containing protein [Variovorax sp. J31P216]